MGILQFSLLSYVIFGLLMTLSSSSGPRNGDSAVEPNDSDFIQSASFMFPKNFLAKCPHEANSYRLKIFVYLLFNLLVKGHGSIDPGVVWFNYNRADHYRILIDAVFYEYLTNFADMPNKELVFNLAEASTSKLPLSTEEIAVDRIGHYLDDLYKTESKSEKFNLYEFLPELEETECEMQTVIQTAGSPGVDYPNFCEILETSFSCDGKRIPGIYADFETGCQMFHVCWHHRKDSFLCPIGTTFNQSTLTCDAWDITECYSSPKFFEHDQFLIDGVSTELDVPEYDGSCESLLNKPLQLRTKFLPAKCKVTHLEKGKQTENKPLEKEAGDLKMRLEKAYNMVRKMLKMLREIRKELAEEMKNRGSMWIPVLKNRLESDSVLNPETTDETAADLFKILGKTHFKPSKRVGRNLDLFEGRTLVKRNQILQDNTKGSKQNVPEIVMGSLKLGGNILNEGIIPLTKQVIIDSYRKIESKKY